MTPRVLVCGGRNFREIGRVWGHLDAHRKECGDFILVSGGAAGADDLAYQWALENDVFFWIFPADWDKDGRAAGPKRNRRMFNASEPVLVMAFPGGRGTADMMAYARQKTTVVGL